MENLCLAIREEQSRTAVEPNKMDRAASLENLE